MELFTLGEIKDVFLVNVKFIMLEKNIKQSELGQKMGGATRQAISNVLNGSGGLNTNTMESIAQALGFKGPELCDPSFRINYLKNKSN